MGWKAIRPVILTLLLIGLLHEPGSRAASGEAIETVGPGTVNWTSGVVTAMGIGVPPPNAVNAAQARAMAERAAFSVAVRNLLEVVKGVRVDSATLVENLLATNDVIKTRVTGLVKGARTVKTDLLQDGSVEVTVAVSLSGELVDAVLPKGFGRPTSIVEPPREATPRPRPMPAPAPQPAPTAPLPSASSPAPIPPAPTAPSPASAYTGLIVDARGLSLKPAMAPRLLDEQGKELYAGGTLTREQAVEAGVAGYSKDMIAGSRQTRVTDNPLIVKGVKVSGNKGTDVVLSEEAVKTIQQTEQASHYLKQARVVLVYD